MRQSVILLVFFSLLSVGAASAQSPSPPVEHKADSVSIHKSDSVKRTSISNIDSLQRQLGAPTDKIQTSIAALNQQQSAIAGSASHKTDSAIKYQNHKIDSVHKRFTHQTDSLQKAYAGPINHLHQEINRLNHKKDSLNKLHLPTQSVTHKIDSLEKANTAKLNELNGKIDKVKKETLSTVSSLHLPPEAQNEINALTKNIHGFSVPKNFFLPNNLGIQGMNLSGLNIPGLNKFSLALPSNLSIPATKIPSLQKINLNAPLTLPSLSKLEGSLASEIKQLQSAASMQSLEKNIMKEASQNAEVKSLLKEETQVKDMESQLAKAKDPKAAAALAEQKLLPAVNHFAGKEKELQSAMGQVSKYKQKYSSVKSLAELPKRAPNPLKDKPWFERVVPGLNYFILSKHSTFVDFNPYVGWRFNPKFTASIGWSERVGISHGNVSTSQYDRVYGIRANASYAWTHGFIFRLSPEVMKAYVPTGSTIDTKEQASVFGLFAGIRKDFKIYKGLIGYSEGMYNFTQKSGQNLYGDRLSFRLGLEYVIKKKSKAAISAKDVAKASVKDSFNIVGSDKRFGVVNMKGDTILAAQYSNIKKFMSDGELFFIVGKNKKYGAFDKKGKTTVPLSFPSRTQVKLEIVNKWASKEKKSVRVPVR
jgi:hypothetical protein